MSIKRYTVTGNFPSNEDLALRIQDGDEKSAELLLLQNEGYITELALRHSAWCDLEDLKQEGALALLEAVKRFNPSRGTKLLTYAAPAIESAMMDYGARSSLVVSIPPSRYHQLRKVAYLCSEKEDKPKSSITSVICAELQVSQKVAAELLAEYRALFNVRLLGDNVFAIRCGGDPARVYDRRTRLVLLHQLMERVLKPRELNLVRKYLGIGQADERGMTFQELAIRLNYNGPSGAEKAYKSALRKLKKELLSSTYAQWIDLPKTINAVRAESSVTSEYSMPQTTWLDERDITKRFLCEVTLLIHVHKIFSNVLDAKEI